jgi:ABC-type Mn2+/Zn2+ transport system ATPase subunit
VVQDVLDELVPPALRPQLAELLPGLDLLSHLPKPLYQLSTGSRRKVFLAAALVQPAPLTLLDQPFMALDRPSVDFLCDRFRAWAHQPDRLLLIADYLPPQDVPLAFTLDLDLSR